MFRKILINILFIFSLLPSTRVLAGSGVQWQSWSESLFQQAQKENRLVLLDLEAVWCHWCHVMEEKTYSDPAVQKILAEKFIAVKVDQDSRPDLANRYQDYGWPATILFNSKGEELAKNAGFLPPEELISQLKSLSENPRPLNGTPPRNTSVAKQGLLSSGLREQLIKSHRESYDEREGGLSLKHKFLDADNVEWGIKLAQGGDETEKLRALQTLKSSRALLDPVWGGVYQYSTGGVWTNPHFEKIMSVQTENLRIYAAAFALWKDPEHLEVAERIHQYLENFLKSPEGVFFTSQDADLKPGEHSAEYFAADDAGRRKQGIPRVDRHIYSRENGWVIESLTSLYTATGEERYLKEAWETADWILRNRQYAAWHGILPTGGFRHDAEDAAGPYLGDSLAMGRAFLALYGATGERRWLIQATQTADFIARTFSPEAKSGTPGFVTSLKNGVLRPVPNLDENIRLTRFANLLFHYTGERRYRVMAEGAMSYLAIPEIATDRLSEAGILLADAELGNDPTHVTILGSKSDPQAQALFMAAVRIPANYKRVEWWDWKEGAMPNPDVKYPEMARSAAFVCSNKLCSSPVFRPEEIAIKVQKLAKR